MKANHRRNLAAGLSICLGGAALLGACAPEPPPVDAEITEAVASECPDRCESLRVVVAIANRGREGLCVPQRYQSRIHSHLFIAPPGLTSGDSYLRPDTGAAPPDVSPDAPARMEMHVRMLRDEPNLYVPPGRKLELVAIERGRYAIPQTRLTGYLRMHVYPCAGGVHRTLELRSPITFKRTYAKLAHTSLGVADGRRGRPVLPRRT